MNNPLQDVPLNTKKVYVMATSPSGCKIYMPVDSNEEAILQLKRRELQDQLNNQPITNNPLDNPPAVA